MFRSFFYLLLSVSLFSCGSQSERAADFQKWLSDNGRVKVLCTVSMITDLIEHVGKDRVDVATLIEGELDPHSYELVKGDDDKLHFAELVVCNGLSLEHGPSLRKYLETSEKVVTLGDWVYKQNPNLILYHSGQTDPHIWMDISIWKECLEPIVKALSQKDPEGADFYRKNAQAYQKELEDAHINISALLGQVDPNKRYLVTSHDAFNYFTRAYLSTSGERDSLGWTVRCAAPEGLSPESQLSVVDIQQIMDHLIRYEISVIFSESNVSQDSIRKILNSAQERGLRLRIPDASLYADAMGAKGSSGDTYIKMITHNAETIAYYLSKDIED